MKELLKQIGSYGIVPVIKIEDPSNAIPLCNALTKGGLPIAEITFRTNAAEEAISRVAVGIPNMLLGAGTILTIDQVKRAISAGAKFIVSPGCNPQVIDYCVKNDIVIIPGCCNPTDIEIALSYGLDTVKFFPAEQYGGISTIKALSAPYGDLWFVPTGGVNENNICDYLSYPKVLACGGSFMVKEEWINTKAFDKVEQATHQAILNMLGFNIAHVGIHCSDEVAASSVANEFCAMFGFERREGASSVFAGDGIEVCNSLVMGANAHIAIKTKNIERAKAFLQRKGAMLYEESAKYKDGSLIAIYLKEQTCGFAIHLLQSK